MKKQSLVLVSFMLAAVAGVNAQTANVGIGTVTADASARLDVFDANKGVLLPRVALQSATDVTTIPAPATGLIVYNTNAAMAYKQGFYYNAGTKTAPVWTRLLGIDGTTTPVVGQTVIWNGNTYVTGSPSITLAPGTPLSGNGTTTNPLTINTASPVYNANSIQGRTVNSTAPTNGQVLIWNSVTNQYVPGTIAGDNWGSQVINTTGSALSGNGTSTTPLTVNTGLAIYNANQINNTSVTGAPTTGQSLVYNGTSYAPGNPSIATTTNNFSGNGTPGSPLTFTGISTTGSPLSGNGTTATPLSINTNLAVYNAGTIQGKTVSATGPTANQALVYNGSQYAPTTIVTGATNGLTLTGNNIGFGGGLTQNTTITTGTNKVLNIAGSATTTTFDATGKVGIGTTAPTNALTINATNPLRLQGLQQGVGSILVVDANGVVMQTPAAVNFHYSTCNTGSANITQANQTGPYPYTQNSTWNGSIPGGGSWTAVPGLSKTITIGSNTNDVSFNCEGVTQYDGVLSTNSFVSYSIGIFVDGKLQATRSFTMVGAGSLAQFDTWQVSGQMLNISAGSHTFAVYVARRNSNGPANDALYFCGPVPTSTATNTNSFMNKGVLFINGSY